MKKALLFSFLLISFISNAQNKAPLVKQWDARFGGTYYDNLSAYRQTPDGGYILGGVSYSDSSGNKTQQGYATGIRDYWVVKIDALGNKQWDKRFGGVGQDIMSALELTSDGGYILGGFSSSVAGGDKTQAPDGSGSDYWIIKIDSLGNKQWDKQFGGSADDLLYSVEQTMDGGFIIGGASLSGISGDKTQPSWGGYDCWIIKTDALGNKQWDKRFGGDKDDIPFTVQQTPDSGYIIGAGSNSGANGDKTQPSWGGTDYWLVKINSAGVKLWDKRYGTPNSAYLSYLRQTPDGGFVLAGSTTDGISGDKTQPNKGGIDYWIVKTDSGGTKQWDNDFGGTGNDKSSSVIQTYDGGYLVCGSSLSPANGDRTESNLGCENIWLVKTDPQGTKQWDKTIFDDGNDDTGFIIQTADGGYTIATSTHAGIAGYKTQANWDTTSDTANCGLFMTTDYWIVKFSDTSACPVINAGTIAALHDTICINSRAKLSTGNTTGILQWQSSYTNNNFTNIPGATSSAYSEIISQSKYYRLVAGSGRCTDTSAAFMEVAVPAPVAVYSYEVRLVTVSFDGSGSLNATRWHWDFGDGDTSNVPKPVHTYDSIGEYHVCLTVTGTANCNYTLCQNVVLWGGVENIQAASNFNIYPNPFTHEFNIATTGTDFTMPTVEIYNVLGQLMLQKNFGQTAGNIFTIDASGLASGMYYLKIKTQQQDYVQPVVKE